MSFTKTLIAFTLFILILSIFAACKKERGIKNNGIIGNWMLTEIYDGYANGGNPKWNKVYFEDSHTLTFSPDGKYLKAQNGTGNGPNCQGTFEFQYDKVVVTTNCLIEPETLNISELNPTTLIIDLQGIEGTIRYKYKAVE